MGKIILVNNLFAPYNRGGAERLTKIMASELIEHGYEVTIITTRPRIGAELAEENKIPWIKILYWDSYYYNLNRLPISCRLFWHLGNIFNWRNYFKMKKIIRLERPQIVITHNLVGLGFLIPRAIKKMKTKHIHYLHDIQLLHPSGLMFYNQEKIISSFPAKIYQKLTRYLFKPAAVIISPSHWLMKLYNEKKFFEQSKQVVLPNPTLTTKVEIKKLKKEKMINVFFVGQIEEHKGVLFLINTFNKLTNNSLKLTVIGNGSRLAEAKRLAQNNPQISFIKWPGDEAAKQLLANANILVVPSLCYENSPSVIYEAASLGVPVIASNLGGITELINHISGLLFEPGNESALIKEINRIVNDENLQKKISRQELATVSQYSQKDYYKKISNIISANNF